MAQVNCVCKHSQEINDNILEVFPEAEVICPKCKRMMNGEKSMPNQELETDTKHPYDPREDLKDDTIIWVELLSRLWSLKKDLYYVFHGLRCAGSKLTLYPEDIKFTFSEELNEDIIDKARKEHLTPNKDLILMTMKRLARDLNGNKTLKDCPF
jgi:hypothetical protein